MPRGCHEHTSNVACTYCTLRSEAHTYTRSVSDALPVDVDCYAGYRGEETPRRLRLGDRLIEVDQVVDRWLAPDHRYFRVKTSAGETYILRHDGTSGGWELTVFERSAPS